MKKVDINETIDSVSEALSELYDFQEAQVKYRINEFLVTDTDSLEEYQKMQPANRERLKKALAFDSREIKKGFEEAQRKAGMVTGVELTRIKNLHERMTEVLNISAITEYNRALVSILRLGRARPLRKIIFEQTQKGIDKALPIKAGKQTMGYKEFMERKVRTEIANEIGDQQLAIGAGAGVVFYICDTYSDCADDHANYQGKIYHDTNWHAFKLDAEIRTRISEFIKLRNILSIQDVREKKPYLTTRPNCRHRIIPISVDQALGISENALLSDLKLNKGVYTKGNADITAEQRYNERAIRNYKNRVKQNELLREKMPSEEIDSVIKKDRILMRKWESRQREHIKQHPDLERDYRRETRNKVLTDMGVRYELKSYKR